MPLPTIPSGNVASALGGGYEVANSCRFNSADSAYMHKTPSSGGDTKKFTISFWVKRSKLGVLQTIFHAYPGSAERSWIEFDESDRLDIELEAANSNKFITNRVFRDTSAWYHIVVVYDSDNGTSGNRVILYVNGVRETSFGTENYPSSGATSHINTTTQHEISGYDATAHYLDGYLAEFVLLDGTAANATSFGEFDEDSPTIWKPIDVSGLTFGTNGFYLDFEDSSNLGNDANGGTDWTEVNLAAIDQSSDSPTNNFATMNPLDLGATTGGEFLDGNLDVHLGGTAQGVYYSTIGVSSGKWVVEVNPDSGSGGNSYIGISGNANNSRGANDLLGDLAYDYGFYQNDGKVRNNDSDASYGSSYSNGNIIGVYLDLDNNKLYFSINGTVQNSGTGVSISAVTNTSTGNYFFCVGDDNAYAERRFNMNFGNPIETISSGNTDGDYGNFEYTTTITGDGASKTFKALCTKNLSEFG